MVLDMVDDKIDPLDVRRRCGKPAFLGDSQDIEGPRLVTQGFCRGLRDPQLAGA